MPAESRFMEVDDLLEFVPSYTYVGSVFYECAWAYIHYAYTDGGSGI